MPCEKASDLESKADVLCKGRSPMSRYEALEGIGGKIPSSYTRQCLFTSYCFYPPRIPIPVYLVLVHHGECSSQHEVTQVDHRVDQAD